MITKSTTKKTVVLRGAVREINKDAKSFQFQPIYGDKVLAFASKRVLDELDHIILAHRDDILGPDNLAHIEL